MSDNYPFPRRASPASSIGSHGSGISHPPGSRKRKWSMVMDGVSSETLLKQVEDWDDGQTRAQSSPLLGTAVRIGDTSGSHQPRWNEIPLPRTVLFDASTPVPLLSREDRDRQRANREASRRFRNRKRNERQLEETIKAQQDEIRKQSELLQQQAEDNRMLLYERDFYRSERDFYRDLVRQLLPDDHLLVRPPSTQATLDEDCVLALSPTQYSETLFSR